MIDKLGAGTRRIERTLVVISPRDGFAPTSSAVTGRRDPTPIRQFRRAVVGSTQHHDETTAGEMTEGRLIESARTARGIGFERSPQFELQRSALPARDQYSGIMIRVATAGIVQFAVGGFGRDHDRPENRTVFQRNRLAGMIADHR